MFNLGKMPGNIHKQTSIHTHANTKFGDKTVSKKKANLPITRNIGEIPFKTRYNLKTNRVI